MARSNLDEIQGIPLIQLLCLVYCTCWGWYLWMEESDFTGTTGPTRNTLSEFRTVGLMLISALALWRKLSSRGLDQWYTSWLSSNRQSNPSLCHEIYTPSSSLSHCALGMSGKYQIDQRKRLSPHSCQREKSCCTMVSSQRPNLHLRYGRCLFGVAQIVLLEVARLRRYLWTHEISVSLSSGS